MPLKKNQLELLRIIFFIPTAALVGGVVILLSVVIFWLLKGIIPILVLIPSWILSTLFFFFGGLAYFYAGIYASPHKIKEENILLVLTVLMFIGVGQQGSIFIRSASPSISKFIQYSPALIAFTLSTLFAWGILTSPVWEMFFKNSFSAKLSTLKENQNQKIK